MFAVVSQASDSAAKETPCRSDGQASGRDATVPGSVQTAEGSTPSFHRRAGCRAERGRSRASQRGKLVRDSLHSGRYAAPASALTEAARTRSSRTEESPDLFDRPRAVRDLAPLPGPGGLTVLLVLTFNPSATLLSVPRHNQSIRAQHHPVARPHANPRTRGARDRRVSSAADQGVS